MRSAIVESVCQAAQVKVAAGLATAPGNIVDVLVDAGFDPSMVLVACSAVSGISSARRAWLDGPLPAWPAGLDRGQCRRLEVVPVTVYRGGLILAYTDPETAAAADTLGLPPHRPVLALRSDLERFFPADALLDPFAPASTQVISFGRDTRDDTAVGDAPDDALGDGPGDGPGDGLGDSSDDGDSSDNDNLDDNQPSEELFVDSFADRLRPAPASTRLPPPEPGRLPPLQPTLRPAARASTTSTPSIPSIPSIPSMPARPLAPSAPSPSIPAIAAAASTSVPLEPPRPPRRPVRLATKRAVAPVDDAPAKAPPFDPAMVGAPPSRTRLLVAAAAVVLVVGGAALVALKPEPVTVTKPIIAVKDGQLDLGQRQQELIARARAETDHALAVRLVSEAIRLDPTSPASLPAYVERVRRAGALGRWQQADTDLDRLRRRPDFSRVEPEVRALEVDLQQKRLSTTLTTPPSPAPAPAPAP